MEGIKKAIRGLYKVLPRGDGPDSLTLDLQDWNFHNLIMTTQVIDLGFRGVEKSFDFGLVQCDLSVAGTGKATFRVSSDYPLNVSSICFVAGFFAELIELPSMSDVLISTIEFNHDYKNLRLDGVKCITVDGLVAQFKAYQKKEGLRLEHKTKVPLSVENVVDMLRQSPNSVDLNVKLSQQKEGLEQLLVATSRNSELIFKLFDKMNGA